MFREAIVDGLPTGLLYVETSLDPDLNFTWFSFFLSVCRNFPATLNAHLENWQSRRGSESLVLHNYLLLTLAGRR
jgi:hypothetical protein